MLVITFFSYLGGTALCQPKPPETSPSPQRTAICRHDGRSGAVGKAVLMQRPGNIKKQQKIEKLKRHAGRVIITILIML